RVGQAARKGRPYNWRSAPGAVGFFDARFEEFGLDFGFLAGDEGDVGLEGVVAGEGDPDVMLARAEGQGVQSAAELAGVSVVPIVNGDSRARWLNSDFELRGDVRLVGTGSQRHFYAHGFGLTRLDLDLAGPVGVPRFTGHDLVVAGEEHDLFVGIVLKLFDVGDIFAIDPDAGVEIDFGLALETDFTQDFVFLGGMAAEEKERKKI